MTKKLRVTARHSTGTPLAAPPPTPAPVVVVPPTPGGPRPQRFAIMIAGDAWTGDNPTTAAAALDGAVFHAPEAGPDETARQAFRTANPSAIDIVYTNFGMSSDDPTWTTCVSTANAISNGYQALYSGASAHPSGFSFLTSVDHGKAGWGNYHATTMVTRLNALSPHPRAVFMDDINCADDRLPVGSGGVTGVPDGYASSAAYAAAIRTQMLAARSVFQAAGYQQVGNIGGIQEWQTKYFPADTLVNVLDYTLCEFTAMFANQSPTTNTGWPRLVSAGAYGNFMMQTFGTTDARARFNDLWARILGAKAAIFSNDNLYDGPIQTSTYFDDDYGTPSAAAVISGSEVYRLFSSGTTLHVDLNSFAAWTTSVTSPTVRHVGAGQTYSTVQLAVAAASIGDSVEVHAGTYPRQTITADKTAYISVVPSPGAVPVIAGFTVDNGSYVDINGSFRTTAINRVLNGSHHVKFRGFNASSITTDYAFYVPNDLCHDIFIEDNSIIAPNQCGFGSSGENGSPTNWSYNIYVLRNSITGSTQDGCFIDGMRNIFIEDNTIWDVQRNSLHNDGIQCTSCDGLYIRRNHIYDTRIPPTVEVGSGIILNHANGTTNPNRLVQNVEVAANLIHNWHGGGLTLDGTINCYIVNNTICDNYGQGSGAGDGYDVGIFVSGAAYLNEGTFEMWNNIFGAIYRGTSANPDFASNNHIEGTSGLTTDLNATVGNALFVTRNASGSYALQSTSAARNSGVARSRTPLLDVNGNAYGTIDRGAVAST